MRVIAASPVFEKLALTAVDYPPMQDPSSFKLDGVKKKIEEIIKHREER